MAGHYEIGLDFKEESLKNYLNKHHLTVIEHKHCIFEENENGNLHDLIASTCIDNSSLSNAKLCESCFTAIYQCLILQNLIQNKLNYEASVENNYNENPIMHSDNFQYLNFLLNSLSDKIELKENETKWQALDRYLFSPLNRNNLFYPVALSCYFLHQHLKKSTQVQKEEMSVKNFTDVMTPILMYSLKQLLTNGISHDDRMLLDAAPMHGVDCDCVDGANDIMNKDMIFQMGNFKQALKRLIKPKNLLNFVMVLLRNLFSSSLRKD